MKLFRTAKAATPTLAPPAPVAATPDPIQSFEQLLEHRIEIDAKIKERQQNEIADMKQKAATVASALGVTVAELLGVPLVPERKEKKKREAKPKYKHPTEPLTWSGRGKHPKWMKDFVDAGADKAEFLIDKA